MRTKLKLKLTIAELKYLNTHIYLTIGSQSMDDLRACLQDYLICATLKELYTKVNGKLDSINFFPTRMTDTLYAVTLTQSQAIALACTLLTIDEASDQNVSPTMGVLPFATDTYEVNFLKTLLGRIHQTFLV